MAISQAMCTSFKKALLDGEMDFSSDTSDVFKIALFTSSATLGASTTAYSTTNEVTGTGYTAGGNTLTVVAPTTSGTTAYLDFSDTTWAASSFTARGALIYNSSKANRAVAVFVFDEVKTTSSGNFQIQFPFNNPTDAVVRVS